MADLSPNELREDIPLKAGNTTTTFINCCTGGGNCFEGSKFISVSFAFLSAVITFALLVQIYYGDYQVIPHGSVATDSRECSEIGTQILKEGGNGIDAVIASAFCLAVVNPHITSLDAEGQLMLYNHRTRNLPEIVDFRHANAKLNQVLPRLVIGLAYIHQQYGQLEWKDLLLPAANLAKQGFLVSKSFATAIQQTANSAFSLYGDLQAGQILRLEALSVTLERISEIPEQDLYNYITLENTPIQSTALKSEFRSYNVYVPNAPSIGPELLINLRHIEQYNFTAADSEHAEYYYRLAETTQQIRSELNVERRFHVEGTSSNIAAIDSEETYVSLVTGLYGFFGAKQMTADGYLMDVKENVLQSTRVPLIVTDADFVCGHRYVFGANNLVTATQIVASLLIARENVTMSVELPRFNLLPNSTIGYEDDHHPVLSDEIAEYLLTLGHPMHMKEPYSSCNIVEKVADLLNSHSDSRGGGISSRFR